MDSIKQDVRELANNVQTSSARTAQKLRLVITNNIGSYRKIAAVAIAVLFLAYTWMTFSAIDVKIAFVGILFGCAIAFNAWLQFDDTLYDKID